MIFFCSSDSSECNELKQEEGKNKNVTKKSNEKKFWLIGPCLYSLMSRNRRSRHSFPGSCESWSSVDWLPCLCAHLSAAGETQKYPVYRAIGRLYQIYRTSTTPASQHFSRLISLSDFAFPSLKLPYHSPQWYVRIKSLQLQLINC